MGYFVDNNGDFTLKGGFTIGGAILLVVLLLIAWPFTVIGPAERGVRVNLGQAEEAVLNPGLHLKVPFVQDIKVYTTTPTEVDYEISVGKDGAISSDNQTIGLKLNMYWAYKPDSVVQVAKSYTKESIESILKTSLLSSAKSTIGNYTIFELAKNQNKISNEVFTELRLITKDYPINIAQLNITNFDWPDSFDKQIEETMNTAQKINQKTNELQVADLESQKQIKIAESEKQALIAKAEGEKQQQILIAEGNLEVAKRNAEAKKVEGEALRVYNEKVAQNLNVQIRLKELDNEAKRIEKWNGQYVPTNNYGPIPVEFGKTQGK